MDAQGIDLPMRDTMQDVAAFRELLMGGGRATVPCLRIEQDDAASSSSASRKHVRWLYESAAIIDYLPSAASRAIRASANRSEANYPRAH